MGHPPGRGALALLYLPLLVPQVAFLFGLQLLFILTGVEATLAALVFAHLVFVLPYAWLALKDPWRAFDRRYDQIAAGLGKGPVAAVLPDPPADAGATASCRCGHRLFGVGRALSAHGADRRGAADDDHHGGGGTRLGRQSPRDRHLCLHADGAAGCRLCRCHNRAGADIPPVSRHACLNGHGI